jgi:hypothetical protein
MLGPLHTPPPHPPMQATIARGIFPSTVEHGSAKEKAVEEYAS